MRKILILSFFALFVDALVAQTSPRNSATVAPSARNTPPATPKVQPENAGKPAAQPPANTRSKRGSFGGTVSE
ncbi:MAG: hypothetical protein IPM98_09620 [Lewinellaceae bacterium]|nr:hypothetical protein [Lewinellaceae bacterium]